MQPYQNDFLDDRSVLITVDEDKIFTEASVDMQTHPAMREGEHREILKRLPDALLKAGAKQAEVKGDKDGKKRRRIKGRPGLPS